MTAETWTIIGTAIAILIAIAASNRRCDTNRAPIFVDWRTA